MMFMTGRPSTTLTTSPTAVQAVVAVVQKAGQAVAALVQVVVQVQAQAVQVVVWASNCTWTLQAYAVVGIVQAQTVVVQLQVQSVQSQEGPLDQLCRLLLSMCSEEKKLLLPNRLVLLFSLFLSSWFPRLVTLLRGSSHDFLCCSICHSQSSAC